MLALMNAAACMCFGGCGDGTISGQGLGYAAARRELDIPVPASATNTSYYLHAAGMQDYLALYRFDLSTTDTTGVAEMFVSDDRTKFRREVVYKRDSLAKARIPVPAPKGVSWWVPSTITEGFFVGAPDGYAYQVWVDTRNGRVFVQQTD